MHAAHVIGDGPVPSSSTNSQSTQLGGPQPLTARSANRDRPAAGHRGGGGNRLAGLEESASGLLTVSTAYCLDVRIATHPDGHWVESPYACLGWLEKKAEMRHNCCPEVTSGSRPETYQLDSSVNVGRDFCQIDFNPWWDVDYPDWVFHGYVQLKVLTYRSNRGHGLNVLTADAITGIFFHDCLLRSRYWPNWCWIKSRQP